MPRAKGAKNYKNDLLIPIVAEILPNGEFGWSAVALAYQEQAQEDDPRNTDDLKRHWIKNLCQSMKKPTGRPGENSDRTHRCIAIERRIMEKTHAGMMGIEESEGEDEDRGDEGEVEVLCDENTLRRSPPRAAKTVANGFIRAQLASSRVPTAEVVGDDDDARVIAEWEARREEEEFNNYHSRIDDPPPQIVAAYTRMNARGADGEYMSPTSPSLTQSVRRALKNAAEGTPSMLNSVRSAMVRTESLAKADKTKNSSNKSKERTSIAGSIAKMIERIDSSSNSTLTTNMNMMLMRQMEEINRGMERRYKEERRERKREKKRRRKRRDKRNAKRRSMMDLDDHGGKRGGVSSESISSESISSSSSSNDSSSQDSGYGKGEWRGQTNIGGGQKS